MNAERLRDNLEAVRSRIAEAARRSGRDPASVTLVAVTKRNPPELVRPLVELGARDLGENYPQELWKKVEALADLPVRWHLIGHLQGNKAKKTLPMVRMIHAVDSLKLLQTLDAMAAESAEPARGLPPGQHLGRGRQARLVAGGDPRATPTRSPRADRSRSSA